MLLVLFRRKTSPEIFNCLSLFGSQVSEEIVVSERLDIGLDASVFRGALLYKRLGNRNPGFERRRSFELFVHRKEAGVSLYYSQATVGRATKKNHRGDRILVSNSIEHRVTSPLKIDSCDPSKGPSRKFSSQQNPAAIGQLILVL